MKQHEYRVGAYCRLSLDDESAGDSASIVTQKQMIERYVNQQGWTMTDTYIDDGYSGTNFERPDFQRLIADIERGKINCVVTKDLSRLGRNYIKTGIYTECYFPEHGVRYIAINDGFDSESNDNDIAPFRNIVNEWYSRDQSKKVKSAMRSKALSGRHLSGYPSVGYIKDPQDNGRYLVDEETAWIVRKIFDWSAHGYGDKKIMKLLYEEKIPCPAYILYQKYGIYGHVFEGKPEDKKYKWVNGAVRTLLANKLYLGHTVTFKSGVVSYKNQKQVQKPPEEWIVVHNTHEPIITEDQFELVQRLHRQRTRSTKKNAEPHILAGITRCADCHAAMRFSTKNYHGKTKDTVTNYLSCGTYATLGKAECTNHYINFRELTDLLLASIRELASQVCADEKGMLKKLLAVSSTESKSKEKQYRADQKKLAKRQQQLDAVFLKLYEDRATGQIAEDSYRLLSRNFEKEKSEITIRLTEIEQYLTSQAEEQADVEKWVRLIKKYRDIQVLDRYIANELLDKVYIGQQQTVDGVKRQKIDIHYRFVGNLNGRL